MSTAFEDTDEWIEEVKDLDFPVLVQRLTTRLYNWLENNRIKQNKVSQSALTMYKKVTDYIQERSIVIFKENNYGDEIRG